MTPEQEAKLVDDIHAIATLFVHHLAITDSALNAILARVTTIGCDLDTMKRSLAKLENKA